jgi:hypothetical protein
MLALRTPDSACGWASIRTEKYPRVVEVAGRRIVECPMMKRFNDTIEELREMQSIVKKCMRCNLVQEILEGGKEMCFAFSKARDMPAEEQKNGWQRRCRQVWIWIWI